MGYFSQDEAGKTEGAANQKKEGGKPADAAEAQAMLQSLMGRRHRVLTAVGLAKPSARSEKRAQALSTSWVEFAPVTAADMAAHHLLLDGLRALDTVAA